MATPNKDKNHYLGTYHMSGLDMYEPQRTNNFELQIEGLDNWITKYADNSNGYNAGKYLPKGTSRLLTLSVKDFDAPNIEVSTITVPYGNNEVKYAGKPSFGGGSVNFNDFIGMDTELVLTSWFKEVYNVRTQAIGRASQYKKEAYIKEFDPSGTYCRAWYLKGLFIRSLNLGSFSNESNDKRQISCNFEYDFCYPVLVGGTYGNTKGYMTTLSANKYYANQD